MEQEVEKFYTVSQLAELTNLPKTSIYALVNHGHLHPRMRNNRTRFYTLRDFNRAKDARLKTLNDADQKSGFMESRRGRASV